MLVVGGQIFGGLLLVTGAAKLRRPSDTAAAIRQLGIPASLAVTYLLALIEVGVGATVLVTGWAAAFAVQGSLFALFLGWVLWSMKSGLVLASCGCLGRDDTPPYWGHVVINVLGSTFSFLIVALSMEAAFPPELVGRLAVGLVVLVGVAAAWVVLDDGARLSGRIS